MAGMEPHGERVREPMPEDLALRCVCGRLRGVAHDVSPSVTSRVICDCYHCRLYAHFLGRADAILDADGGTDAVQLSPRCVEITEGREHLGLMRLTDRGGLRWYARCCKTPLAITLASPGVPFVGINHLFVDRESSGPSLEPWFGPVRARVNTRVARGRPRPPRATLGALFLKVVRLAWLMIGWRLRGDHRRSPFFDPATGRPLLEPERPTEAELAPARAALG
ncbi:MAG: DUF6151 family protein [Sandaracinaceae bacterium]